MKFGMSAGMPPEASQLEIVSAAAANGFDQIWVWDSHIIWNETYTLIGWLVGKLGDAALNLDWGTLVTNPATRDPLVTASAFATLNNITGGRAICGIGRGDSAARVLGRKPVTLADVEYATDAIHHLTAGEAFETPNGVQARLATGHEPWTTAGRVPVYHGAYGPKALTLAGRVADGVIFQIADPFFIEWGLQYVHAGAKEAGRDPRDIVVHCSTASVVTSDAESAREQLRWFPAAVGNHIADVLQKNDPGNIPSDITNYIAQRPAYDYSEHGERGTEHSKYVPDEIVDRFCVHGTPEQITEKLLHLKAIGVNEFNLYPQVPDIKGIIETYGRDIIGRVNA